MIDKDKGSRILRELFDFTVTKVKDKKALYIDDVPAELFKAVGDHYSK